MGVACCAELLLVNENRWNGTECCGIFDCCGLKNMMDMRPERFIASKYLE